MLSDIEIAHATKLKPIAQVAAESGIAEDEYEPYGRDKAKVSLKPRAHKARLVLMTATSGMPAGSGKTTTTIALAQALRRLGKTSCAALREPSLGPCFGMKGGAAGGGYSQVLPMEAINLHFTGDLHAVTTANNLIAALIDNARMRGDAPLKEVTWRRVLDLNDRGLRSIVTGLGGTANGGLTETGFDITAASEIMAVLCLADGLEDLRARIDRLVLGIKTDGTPYTCKELGATGSVMALLLEASKPNLVQTIEGGPAFVHGGPFANIAHGCNSVAATRAAIALAEYAITEAGFGSDLGAEKFFNIKCRSAGLEPSAVVLVTSTRAIKWHGGVPLAEIGKPNAAALAKGTPNLERHIDNLRAFGLPVVVSLNDFGNEVPEEVEALRAAAAAHGARFAVSKGFALGGAGAEDLAREVIAAAEPGPVKIHYTYELDAGIEEKIDTICRRVYGADGATLSAAAKKDLARIESWGFAGLPVCIAKTPYSLSHEPTWLGAPSGYKVPVQRLILNAGAGFVVAIAGSIMRMPGLPKKPAAYSIDVVDGQITGLA